VSGPDDDWARRQAARAYLATTDWAAARVEALPADASFRRYFRLHGGPAPALLMDAPPGPEDIGPFVDVAGHLIALGFSAPRVFGHDRARGFALVEDLGDETFSRIIARGAAIEPLYALAVDVLAALHRHPRAAAVAVPDYSTDLLAAEAALLADWYLAARDGAEAARLRGDHLALWHQVLADLPATAPTLVLRDFHVDNLMRLDGREGVGACGLLDFQDAVIGPPAYDLMSLLQDARRDVPETLAAAMRERYFRAVPVADRAAFDRATAVLAAQRHAKVAGIFVRLWARDGKAPYLAHIPRVIRLLGRALSHPALAELKRLLGPALARPPPDFDARTAARLKAADREITAL